ncbi:MAG: hypothetical protein Q9P90_11780, partial [candidate division KSB1 bacterium]|nr:hypothetical protein [candidate division KSB1 bacterium]
DRRFERATIPKHGAGKTVPISRRPEFLVSSMHSLHKLEACATTSPAMARSPKAQGGRLRYTVALASLLVIQAACRNAMIRMTNAIAYHSKTPQAWHGPLNPRQSVLIRSSMSCQRQPSVKISGLFPLQT